jgi:hypothetical protein
MALSFVPENGSWPMKVRMGMIKADTSRINPDFIPEGASFALPIIRHGIKTTLGPNALQLL